MRYSATNSQPYFPRVFHLFPCFIAVKSTISVQHIYATNHTIRYFICNHGVSQVELLKVKIVHINPFLCMRNNKTVSTNDAIVILFQHILAESVHQLASICIRFLNVQEVVKNNIHEVVRCSCIVFMSCYS